MDMSAVVFQDGLVPTVKLISMNASLIHVNMVSAAMDRTVTSVSAMQDGLAPTARQILTNASRVLVTMGNVKIK